MTVLSSHDRAVLDFHESYDYQINTALACVRDFWQDAMIDQVDRQVDPSDPYVRLVEEQVDYWTGLWSRHARLIEDEA